MHFKNSVRWNSAPITLSIKKKKETKLMIPDPDVDKGVQKVDVLYMTGGSSNSHNLLLNKLKYK